MKRLIISGLIQAAIEWIRSRKNREQDGREAAIIPVMDDHDDTLGGTVMAESPWQYFTREELACRHCGEMKMDNEFMRDIVALRRRLGFAFPVTSAYRCPEHNQRVSSTGADGPHTTGRAIDIAVSGIQAIRLLEAALSSHDFTGIGIQQKGAGRFIHLDAVQGSTRPAIWSY